jgi:hypothetical protein
MNNQNRSIYDNNDSIDSYEARLQNNNQINNKQKKKGFNFHINIKLVLCIILVIMLVAIGILLIPKLKGKKNNDGTIIEMKLITSSMSLKIGEEKKIEYNFANLGNDTPKITYKTENSLVATVSESGLVKAVGSGNTYIIITYNNGEKNVETKCKISIIGESNNNSNENTNNNSNTNNNTNNNNNNSNNNNSNNNNTKKMPNGMTEEEYEKMVEELRKKAEANAQKNAERQKRS